jgi:hypothetical protein
VTRTTERRHAHHRRRRAVARGGSRIVEHTDLGGQGGDAGEIDARGAHRIAAIDEEDASRRLSARCPASTVIERICTRVFPRELARRIEQIARVARRKAN